VDTVPSVEYVNLTGLERIWQPSVPPAAGGNRQVRVLKAFIPALRETGETQPGFPELHILSAPQLGHVVFHPPGAALFRANEAAAALLAKAIQNGAHRLEPEAAVLIEQIKRQLALRPPLQVAGTPPGVLQKLVLNVSNDCTLRCRYCYAHGGQYTQPRGLMSAEIARQAIIRIYAQYPLIGTVLFFGGEPGLNPGVIQASCEQILTLYRQKRIERLPLWGMVTNGWTLDQTLLDVIRRYHLVVTVSLDGPPEIQDRLRPAQTGQATHARIAENIRLLQHATGGREPSRIETTYTLAHQQAGVTIDELIAYFDNEFGIDDIHLTPVAAMPGQPLHWQPANVDRAGLVQSYARVLESWATPRPRQISAVSNCLQLLVTRRYPAHRCGAGFGELTVLANGDVYPCYLLLKKELRIGNVNDPALFTGQHFQTVQQMLADGARDTRQACRACWARGACRVCAGAAEIESQGAVQTSTALCAFSQSAAQATLLTLCRLQADPPRWQTLLNNAARRIEHNLQQHLNRPLPDPE